MNVYQQPYVDEPCMKQNIISKSKTRTQVNRTLHERRIHNEIHDHIHGDVFFQPFTSTTAKEINMSDDMNEGSSRFISTASIVTPMFNENDPIMEPFLSVVSDLNSGRKLIDDLTLESKQNVSSDQYHHLYQNKDDDDDDDVSIHPSDFLMALDGIHIEHPEDSIGIKVGTTVNAMKSQNRNKVGEHFSFLIE